MRREISYDMPVTDRDTTELIATELKRTTEYDDPFSAFYERRNGWVNSKLRPELMVRAAQFLSGVALYEQGLFNLYGWALEETERHQRLEGDL